MAPQIPQSAAARLTCPLRTRSRRFCRTLNTASCGRGTPEPQAPILAAPDRSITRLASPALSGL
ncbi:MAG: hypothetical protein ACRDRJ_25525, partial [Streptosporangiaceae bacterium]